MKRYLNPKLMMFVLVLALSLLAVVFGRLPKVGATPAPNPTCTMNPVVNNNANSGAGSLRQAVIDACAGSTITFANNVTGTIFLQDGQITIDKNLTIQGPSANLLTIQNTAPQSATSRVFLVEPGVTATIAGLTISGGKTSGGGGISNNGTLTVTNATIENNDAGAGGGIYNFVNSILNVANSTIENNHAANGGGVYNAKGTVNVTNSTINNNVSGAGGGLYNSGILTFGVLTITNSTISNNSVAAGTTDGGAGIYNGTDGRVNLTNSTISSNSTTSGSSSAFGGGINNFHGGTVNCRNTIIAGNTGSFSDFAGTLTSQGYNLIGSTSGTTIMGDTTGNITGTSALLSPLLDNGGGAWTHALLPGSPAIDAAANCVLTNNCASNNLGFNLTTDQRGTNRLAGSAVDIGAFEAQRAARLAFGVHPTSAPPNTTFAVTVQVSDASNNPVTTSTATVNLAFGNNPSGETLSGTTSVAAAGGLATFNNLSVNLLGTGYTLVASSSGLTDAISDAFNAAPNPPCTVNPVVTNNGNSGAGSLRQTVLDACAGSTITFANNVRGTIPLSSGQITLDKNLTIQGPGADVLAVQNVAARSATSRIFKVNQGVTSTISGLAITGGYVLSGPGGGIYNEGNLSVMDSKIHSNRVTIINAFIDDFYPGGGIFNSLGAVLTVTDSTISSNYVYGGQGGGIFNALGTVTVNRSIIRSNFTAFSGGGISNQGASNSGVVTVTDSTIAFNVATNSGTNGAGLANNGGTIILINSTVSTNIAAVSVDESGSVPEGGGISNINGTLSLINTTITNNQNAGASTKPVVGGGIFNSGGTVNSRNSIIAGNIGVIPDLKGTLNSQGYNLIGNSTSATIAGDATGNIVGTSASPVDARLAQLGFYGGPTMTNPLLAGSPAINAGNTATSPVTDQRGADRVGTADIGAFEFNYTANGGNFVATLPDGITGIPYSYVLVPINGSYRFGQGGQAWIYSMTGGALPSGISISTNGSTVSIGGTTNQSGVFNFTVTGTDGVNSIGTEYRLRIIPVSSTPTITATPVTRNAGSATANLQIATVNDPQDAESTLAVTINGGALATVTGVTVNAISVSAAGIVTADVAAACGATTANFTLRVTDSGSLFNEATLTVTVTPDKQPPTITCLANISKNTDANACTAIVTYTTPTVTDGCPGTVNVICSPASGTAFAKGTTTVTCTATDAGGNPASCSFTVSVNDTQMPSLSACPANLNVSSAGGCVNVSYTPPTVSDNCPGATVTCAPPSGSCFAVGTTTVTCTGTDSSSNTTTCSFTVAVSLCSITCPANVIAPTASGQCQAVVNYNTPTTTGSCGTVTCSPPSGSSFPKGTTPVNCATQTGPSCSFSVTVNDTQKPTLGACPANISASSTAGCVNVTYTPPTVSDNCPGATVSCVPPSGTCFGIGTTPVTCTGDDTSNNTAMCTFTVTVSPCTITCPANVTAPTTSGQCQAVVNYNAPTTTGSCGTVTCSPASGSTFPKGTTTVTCGTQAGSSCSFTVTVNDTQAPQINCPANVTQATANGQCQAVVSYVNATATDNCSGVGTPVCTPASGSVFSKGVTTVTCAVTDASGNTGSCNFTITVNDNQAPTIACPANVNVPATAGQCAAVVSYATPPVTDNCPNVGAPVCSPASGTSFARGVTTVSCTVGDASGNTKSCSFTVTVNDTTPPQIACPANITKPTDAGQCAAIVSYTPTATDNCSGVTVACTPPSGSSFAKGMTTVSCVATDTSNNSATCSFSVTVNDTQAPQIACPSNQTRMAATPGAASVMVTYVAPAISDNCPGATVACVPPSGSAYPLGTTTVTCTARDAAGNTTSCAFTVTVYDIGLQDDSNPATVVLANSMTGQYRFCYSGTVFTGTGSVIRQGSTYTVSHNASDRRVTIRVNAAGSPPSGTAVLQTPPGVNSCSITDRDIRNNSCQCP